MLNRLMATKLYIYAYLAPFNVTDSMARYK